MFAKYLLRKSQYRLSHCSSIGGKFKMEVELDGEINFEEDSCATEYLAEFPVVDSTIPYSEFFQKFLMKNQACLIKNVSPKWESTKLWVENDLPNFSYLKSKYGETNVSIHDCDAKGYYYSQKHDKWKFQDYLEYWENYIKKDYPKGMPVYYLKDWHLKNESPDDNFYEVPLHFASDWINEYLVENGLDDYRFIYMGTKGTWSPFHVDIMTSHSWSSNICGQKRWVLFPPGEENYLRDHLGNLPHDITDLKHDRKCIEVIQNPGEALFVPTNWHHQVWNLKDTISINHNWINGCNLKSIWCSLDKNLSEVKNEIKDCEDMEDFLDHCQVMLQASFGLHFMKFYDFISYIACKRIEFLNNKTPIELPENRKLGKKHALFDLWSIKNTLALFNQHKDVQQLSSFKNVNISPVTLMSNIETTLVYFKESV